MNPTVINDARRWAAFRSFASYYLLLEIRPSMHWAQSAHRAGLPNTVVAYYVREALNRCAALESLLSGGQLPDIDEPFYNGIPIVSDGRPVSALSVASALGACADEDRTRSAELLNVAEDLIQSVESGIGLEEPFPSLDGPEGMYPALLVARESLRLSDEAGLPPAMPEDWIPGGSDGQAG